MGVYSSRDSDSEERGGPAVWTSARLQHHHRLFIDVFQQWQKSANTAEEKTLKLRSRGKCIYLSVAERQTKTETTEGQALWQPGGAEEDNRFREGNRHFHLAYEADEEEEERHTHTHTAYLQDGLGDATQSWEYEHAIKFPHVSGGVLFV